LKLGELAYYTHARESRPILVMDEVASVLDRDRTGNLVALLSKEASQVFITSPTEDEFGKMATGAGCIVRVNEKRVKK
jgi:recombinational DNA repair ATPase RecF